MRAHLFSPFAFCCCYYYDDYFSLENKEKEQAHCSFFLFFLRLLLHFVLLCVSSTSSPLTHTRAYHHCTALTSKYKKRTHRLRLIVACCSVGSLALLYHYSQSIFLLFSFFFFIFIFLKNILDCRHIRSRDVHFIYLCADLM